MELKQNSKIYFNEEYHDYIDEDFNTFHGVTDMIRKCVCPDLYKDVPKDILATAAVHGSVCHKLCEYYDNGHIALHDDGNYYTHEDIIIRNDGEVKFRIESGEHISDQELLQYIDTITFHKLSVEASEYLVSDNKNFASQIDKVIRDSDNEFSILDLKFTAQYHEEPVTWQTSFYADMFEQQNPGAKVKNLYCLHIHVKKSDGTITCKLHKLERIPTKLLEECKRCYLTDTPFDNPLAKTDCELADITFSIDDMEWNMKTIATFLHQKKEIEDKHKKLSQKIKDWFADHPNYNRLKTPDFTASQSSATTSFCFDEERLKAELPDIYRQYCTGIRTTAPRTVLSLTKKSR